MVATKCRCRFKECLDESDANGTCYLKHGGYCFAYFEEIIENDHRTYSIEKRFGCLEPGEGSLLQCKGYLSLHNVMKNISCCNSNDYCNDNLFVHVNDGEIIFTEEYPIWMTMNLQILSILTLILILMMICLLIIKRYKYKLKNKEKEYQKNDSFSDKLLLPHSINKTTAPCLSSATTTLPQQYTNYINNVCDSSGYSSGGTTLLSNKYNTSLNISVNTNTNNSMMMESNLPYQCLSSGTTSNTTSSLMSENTQQTMISSQKSSRTLNDDSITSGSGSGVPCMKQSTIAMEIDLIQKIGEGRFGRVYLGVRHCEKYAIKIFNSINTTRWTNEVEIYQSIIMRHENIVTFLASDIISNNGCTELWLVTEYHPLGSLYDFLKHNQIKSIKQMINIMRSIIFGLSHLHLPVIGTKGKPRIAHRDIKSKNILMKSLDSCCISDFASAIIKSSNDIQQIKSSMNNDQYNNNNNNNDLQIFGTIRYMAPEILDRNIDRFEDFLYGDIYSLGLVYWEIINCLQLNDSNQNNCYKKPYYEYLSSSDEPKFDEMYRVVCLEKQRPTIRNDLKLSNNPIIAKVINLIGECLFENRFARLTSLNIKKKIINIFS